MSSKERKIFYFKKPGKANTNILLKTVKEYAKKEGLRDFVVASTTGETGAKAAKMLRGSNMVVVTHAFGFKEAGRTELQDEFKKEILEKGARIFTGVHALSSVERAIRRDFGTIQTLELIANTLRLMGEGTKVCVEIALMAADAGLVPMDGDIIAIGGSGRGADTALRIKPAHASEFFKLRIREIIAKPNTF